MKELTTKTIFMYNTESEEREPVEALRGESAYVAAKRLGLTTLTEEEWLQEYNVRRDAAIEAIDTAAEGAKDDIEIKTEEQLTRIPEVTALAQEVSQLSEEIDNFANLALELVEPINLYNPEGDGYYNRWNDYISSLSFKWMRVSVAEGDVVRLFRRQGTADGGSKYVTSPNMIICAFSGGVVDPDKGDSNQISEFTVPSGIDELIVSVNVAAANPLITLNLATPPIEEVHYFESYYDQRTDETLLTAHVAADAKAVGDKFSRLKADTVDILLPKKVYAYVAGELNLYHKNVIDCDAVENLGIKWSLQGAAQYARGYNECLRVNLPAERSVNYCELVLFDRKTQDVLKRQYFDLFARVSPTTPLKVMFIGDSLTEYGYYPAEIIKNLSGGNVTSIGTRTTNVTIDDVQMTVTHEGRSGWSTKTYTQSAERGGTPNAFWNANTSKFDFGYYMSQNNFDGVDVVVIALGSNDAANLEQMDINSILSAYSEMIASIQEYASANSKTVNVVLSLVPPSAHRDGWGNTSSRIGTPNNFDYYQRIIVRQMIATFENQTGVWLAPTYANLDTDHDFPTSEVAVSTRNPATVLRQTDNVHPNKYGYLKMADTIWAAIANAEAE